MKLKNIICINCIVVIFGITTSFLCQCSTKQKNENVIKNETTVTGKYSYEVSFDKSKKEEKIEPKQYEDIKDPEPKTENKKEKKIFYVITLKDGSRIYCNKYKEELGFKETGGYWIVIEEIHLCPYCAEYGSYTEEIKIRLEDVHEIETKSIDSINNLHN